MMDAALKYAEANIPVIPLHWICEDGSCSCKKGQQCDSKGKHPLYTGWYKNSTADVEQIRKWWTKTPNANIGIPTGEKSGWLVLDVDDGGNETLSALEATHENFRIRLLLLQEVAVSTMSSNTQKAGAFLIKQSLHRVLIRVQQVD
jgi:hypothetical protein